MYILEYIKLVFASIGSLIMWYIGGADGLIYALISFVTVDYVTGVAVAVMNRKLSSSVGFKGIARKVIIFLLIGVAHLVDTYVTNSNTLLRSAVCCYYIANEGISILENASLIGLPIPKKLREVLIQLKQKGDDTDNECAD